MSASSSIFRRQADRKGAYRSWSRLVDDVRALEIASAGLLMLAACAAVAYVAWTLDRGFEITDEAYYFLLAIHPEATRFYISAQQWVMSPIWQITGSLAAFRAAGLVLLVGSSVVLAMGALAAVRNVVAPDATREARRIAVMSATIVCGLLYAITINVSPSYNLLASVAAYFALGLALLGCHKAGGASVTLFLGAGAAIAVEFVCKPSSGVVTFFLALIGIVGYERSGRIQAIAFIAMLGGALAAFAVLLLSNTTFDEAHRAFRGGIELFRMVQPEPAYSRLGRYVVEFAVYTFAAVQASWLLVVAALLYLARRNRLTGALVILALGHTLVATRYFEYGVPQLIEYMQRAVVLLGLMLAVTWSSLPSRLRWLIVLLGLLPYSVAVGTGNAVFSQVIISLAPWGALMALAAFAMPARAADRLVPVAILVTFVAITTIQMLVGVVKPGYGLNEETRRQVHPVRIGPLGTVKVDGGTKQFMQQIDAAIANCAIVPGSPFLGLYHLPGLALALNVVPVATPWLNNYAQADAVFARDGVGPYRGVIAIKLNSDRSLPRLPAVLQGFPSGYRYCGNAVFPHAHQDVGIWSAGDRP